MIYELRFKAINPKDGTHTDLTRSYTSYHEMAVDMFELHYGWDEESIQVTVKTVE